MEQYTDNSGLYLNDLIPYGQPVDVLVQLWDKAEQEILAIQHKTDKRIQPERSDRSKKTIDAVRYAYD